MSAASAPTNTPPILWVCATVVGLTTTSILFCSHFHQSGAFTCGCAYVPLYKAAFTVGGLILVVSTGFLFTFLVQGDLAAGKMSPLVRLGTLRAATVLKLSVWGTYALLAGAAAVGAVPLIAVVACALSLPAAHSLVRLLRHPHPVKPRARTHTHARAHTHTRGLISSRLHPRSSQILTSLSCTDAPACACSSNRIQVM
jgi:1,4-dihydroxy-2-naphthoate octaprenyltransferase